MITNIKLSGLTCPACQKLVSKRIKSIEGVAEVNVGLSGKTDITAERSISEEEVEKVLEGTGYQFVNNQK